MTTTGKDMVIVGNETQSLALSRDPEAVLEEAHRAAKALTNVLRGKKKPLMFKGEQYLEFEDWLTVARFYGLAVRTKNARPVEVDGIKGAMAEAEVVEVKSGNVLGMAESYCMRDEQNWGNKPWFQLASMAQTRAGAKALRNLLSWVVVLGGYRGTPAEELEESVRTVPAQSPVRAQVTARSGPPVGPAVVSDVQARRFYAMAKTEGHWPDEDIKAYLMDTFGVESTFKIPLVFYDEACAWAQSRRRPVAPAIPAPKEPVDVVDNPVDIAPDTLETGEKPAQP